MKNQVLPRVLMVVVAVKKKNELALLVKSQDTTLRIALIIK
jgi:hypothetical protein